MYNISSSTKTLHLITEHELSKEEDAPMTIAIHRPVHSIFHSLYHLSHKRVLIERVDTNVE